MKLRYSIIALLCIGAAVWMLVLLQHNVVFFKPVSTAVHDRSHDGRHTLRIGGGVVPDSIVKTATGDDFKLTQGGITVTVHHTGGEPPLFKDCAPVVAEGHWATGTADTFDSTRLLIKHNNNYEPPKVATKTCPPDEAK